MIMPTPLRATPYEPAPDTSLRVSTPCSRVCPDGNRGIVSGRGPRQGFFWGIWRVLSIEQPYAESSRKLVDSLDGYMGNADH